MKKKKVSGIIPFKQDAELFFRIGVKYANKKMFNDSLRFFDKAVKLEPFNADYQFNRACVLAEIKEIKKSNDALLNILKNIDPTMTDCYFGIGCNFFDVGNLKKAKEYFEKYIYFEPNGQFVDETYDILYYLQVYDDVGPGRNRNKQFLRLTKEGKDLLKAGLFLEACAKLEKAIEIDPEAKPPRNDLSIALFCAGEEDKAISVAKSVLKLEPKNVIANCNLLLFFASARKLKEYNEQLKVVASLEISDKEHFIKLLDTYIKLDDHLNIVRIMVDYLREKCEPIFYHLVSIAFFNLKEHGNAKELWDSMNTYYPQYHLLTSYYSEINVNIINGTKTFEKLDYNTKLPEQLDKENAEKLSMVMGYETSLLEELWKKDRDVKDVLSFYLYEGTRELKLEIIEKLSKSKDEEIKVFLHKILEQSYVAEDIKGFLAKKLGLKKWAETKKESDKDIPRKMVSMKISHIQWQQEWDAVIDCALKNREVNYQSSYKNELKNIWMNFIDNRGKKGLPIIKKSEIWAAALEYIYCNRHLIRVSKRKLAEKYNVSTTSITKKLRDFNKC